jgi:hypothetical protein
MLRKTTYFLLCSAFILTFGCKKSDDAKEEEQTDQSSSDGTDPNTAGPNTIVVRYSNMVHSHDVDQTGTTMYANAAGQQFNVLHLKYYVSNFILINQDGSEYAVQGKYQLINEDDIHATGYVHLEGIPNGSYIGVRFMMGVDSPMVASGNQDGDLDPSLGMYWSATNGYKAFSMTGNSNVAAAPSYSYEVGGYTALRVINLSFNGTVITVDGSNKPVKPHIYADLLEVFKNPVNIDFNNLSVVNSPGSGSVTIADNYADMFKVDHFDP